MVSVSRTTTAFLAVLLMALTTSDVLAQNTKTRKYSFGAIFASEFYNADFKTLNELLDSRELLSSSFGLVLDNKEQGAYATIEYQSIRSVSDEIDVKGNAIYVSANYNLLKSLRHLLYPRLSVMATKYQVEANENLLFLAEGDELSSNFQVSSGLGVGYEYLFKLNFLKKISQFALGLNLEKSFILSKNQWKIGDLAVDFFDANLLSGIRTKVVIRIIL